MQIKHGLVFDLEKGFTERGLEIQDGVIVEKTGTENDEIVDASGCYVIPGLLDVHFHGCIGEDFSDATADGLQKMADYELSEGVTYICPAGMTLPEEQLARICRNAANHKKNAVSGAELVGVHLEGPFLSQAKKGAQNSDFLHKPDADMLLRLQKEAEGLVKLVTLAPEEENGMEFIRRAVEAGIHVSIGHTAADYDTALAAFKAGADHVTHLYNGMPPIHHRAPGVIMAAFDSPNTRPEIICDGVHIHGSVIRGTFQLFGAERMILISDSLRATGMPDGEYPFGGQMIEVHGNRATILGHPETLAGSVTSLMGCLRQAVAFGIPLADAVRAASYNPAVSIGVEDRIGSLDVGKDGTAVLLDKEDLSVRGIIFKGKRVK